MAYDRITGHNEEALNKYNLSDFQVQPYKVIRKCVWCEVLKGCSSTLNGDPEYGLCPSCARHFALKDLGEHRQEPDRSVYCDGCNSQIATQKYVFGKTVMNTCDECASRLLFRQLNQ